MSIVGAFLISLGLTYLVRNFVLARGIVDHPNARSSHAASMPRGGGVSIVVTSTFAALFLAWTDAIDWHLPVVFLGGGLAVAWIGFMDDCSGVSPAGRIAIHAVAVAFALWVLGGVPPIQWAAKTVNLGWMGTVLGGIAMIWVLNLFNFMDGIDGIAASEAAFIAWGGALVTLTVGGTPGLALLMAVFGAACFGFLVWNWPPAKIFMGDVGSGYLGYVIAVLALAGAEQSPASVFVWLILGGVFFVDATVTLLRRIARSERPSEAHRTHAYQWLARRWGSHLRVTLAVLTINILWLLPLAWMAAWFPASAYWIAVIALAPLVIISLVAGAGRQESRTENS